jgi:hypothetical protein
LDFRELRSKYLYECESASNIPSGRAIVTGA